VRGGEWLQEVDRRSIRQGLREGPWPSDALRAEQLEALRERIAARDEQAVIDYLLAQPNRLVSAVEDQVAQGVLYSLLTADHGFIGANARGLLRIDQEDPADPLSRLREPLQVDLPDALFDDERVRTHTIFQSDAVFGLGMTFNGFLVINTLGGSIATLDRQSLQLIDVHRAGDLDEVFTNSFATSPETGGGAVYVASNRRLYRLVVAVDGQIQADAAAGPGRRRMTGVSASPWARSPMALARRPRSWVSVPARTSWWCSPMAAAR
ncbi:MAG: hypothetical protein ACO3IJ_12480, partial [Steroidobacteraceae bacterium]